MTKCLASLIVGLTLLASAAARTNGAGNNALLWARIALAVSAGLFFNLFGNPQ